MRGLTVAAEGDLPSGEHWILTVGGTTADYYTLLKTVYADGQVDEGGFGGPALYPGYLLNTYTGDGDRLRRILARTALQIQRIRLELADGQHLDLWPVAHDRTLGLAFFAALLPPTTVVRAMYGIDADGHDSGA